MNQNLKNLISARASSEQTSLRNELQNVSTDAINAGQHGSIQHHKAALKAAGNTAVATLHGAFDDYKTVVDAHRRKYKPDVLNQLKKDFAQLLRAEINGVTAIVENVVPGIPKFLSPAGMQLYKTYADRYLKALSGVETRASLYNETTLAAAPSFPARVKKKVEDNPVTAVATTVLVPVVLFLMDKFEAWKPIIELFK